MKRSLVHGETRLERRQAHVNEQVRRIDATSARLAQQAEELHEQERVVVERREEVERHLEDMREWYRRKLRELSLVRCPPAAPAPHSAEGSSQSTDKEIIAFVEELDPGDRKLGDLLRSLDLVDAETLASLLQEARRQHRTLRQVLLAGGYLTLYQMALIETGHLDGLVLGSLRVIDRLWVTPREAVYRVFDPRCGQEAVLRHLSEAEMLDAVHSDEFRQRFTQAAQVKQRHWQASLEVLEISGRPAVLQEWVAGLPSTDWPSLAAAPGVWHRLLSAAATALQAAHEAGLVHGHLQPGLFLLNGEGELKTCGLGEPPWLLLPPAAEPKEWDTATDLFDLGRTATYWTMIPACRKGTRIKPLPEVLERILGRLVSPDEAIRYPEVAALLEDLAQAGAGLSANNEAWERLVHHVRENAVHYAALKESA
jgi:hypothetical protein